MREKTYELKINDPAHVTHTVSVHVDCNDTMGTYHVSLTHDTDRNIFIVTPHNYFYSMETTNPRNCSYKLQERGMLDGDANVVQQIVRDILYPMLMDILRAETYQYHMLNSIVDDVIERNDITIPEDKRNEVMQACTALLQATLPEVIIDNGGIKA